MPSLALVCAHTKVFIIVWRLFPSGVSGQFIGATSGNEGSTTGYGTFLFRTFSIDVQMTSGNLDLLHRL